MTYKLDGAAEARRAHNPEDEGSKPSQAIFLSLLLAAWMQYNNIKKL